MTKKPSYRFADYTEPWAEKKLGEVAEIYDGTHQTPIYTTEGVMFLSVENIRTLHSDKYISKDAFDKDFKISPKSGDVLMTRIGDIGTSNIVETDIDLAYYVSLALIRSCTIESKFLNVSISSDYFQKELWKRTLHIAFPKKINKNEIGQSKFFFPSLPEQTAIGSFFQDIDQLISLQQRKLEVLKEQKKTYLKLFFPAKGQTKPALRFAGFEDEWEQQKASEIFYSVSDKNHVDLPVLSASQEHGMVKRDEIGIDIKYDKASVKTYKRVKPGQFVIHLRSFQGGFAHSDIEGITSPAYTVLDFSTSNKHYDLFWKEVSTSQSFIKRLETVTYGIRDGRSISFSDFSSLKLQFPSLPEQEAIGAFFQDLDKSIAKQEEKVNQLKESKQTLLRKMFI